MRTIGMGHGVESGPSTAPSLDKVSLDFVFTDDELILKISGWDVVWSLHREVRAPIDAVTSITVQAKEPLIDELAFRLRGGSMPGVVMAGRFSVWKRYQHHEKERQFWLTKRKSEVLVVQTAIAQPSRLVLEVPDAREQARLLTEELAAHRFGADSAADPAIDDHEGG